MCVFFVLCPFFDPVFSEKNDQIDELVALDRHIRGEPVANQKEQEEVEARRQRGVKIAIYGSFVLNICLFLGKIAAVVSLVQARTG